MEKAADTSTPDTQLFRDVFNASPIGIAVENLDGEPLFVNPAFCSMIGFSAEELCGKHCVDFSPPEDAEKDWALFQQLRAGSIDHYQLEKRYFRRDGSLVWGNLSLSLLKGGPSPLVLAMVEDITDKKRAEEARFRHTAIVESSEDAIGSVTLDGVIESWNRGAQRIFEYAESEILGKTIEVLVPPERLDEEKKILETLRAGGRIDQFETVRVTKTGRRIDVSLSISPIKDSTGKIVGFSGISRDITERKRAEQAVSASEERLARANERLHLAIESGSVGGWDYELKTGQNLWFGKAHAQLGMAPDETSGSLDEFWDRVHQDDRERLRRAFQLAKDRHERFTEDFRVVWRDGTTHWLHSQGCYHYGANAQPERMLGISLDITEQKLAEEVRLRHAAIVESSDDGISSVTLDGLIVTWNAGAQRIFGYNEDEVVGKPASIIVPPELRDEQKNKILATLWAGGRIEQFETVRVSKTGRRIDVSLSISPIKDSTGKIVGCAGIARDITNRKQAEEALLSSERRYRLLFERNVAGVAIASLDGRLLDCNDGWKRILGYESRDELLGRHASDFYFNPAERQPLVDELFEKQVLFSRDLQLRRKDGTPVWVLFNAAVHSDHDKPIVQATMIDISERKSAEEALSGMTRKLIEAQEQERARIGRELHDDISQRLAMLAIELERLQIDSVEARSRLHQLREETIAISSDVQALSHELHSSKLEYLGVVSGIKSWCREFGERQKMEIDFRSDVSSPLPFEIGLSLFRVLQEALHNAAKHSGAKRAEVEVAEDSNEVHLIVRDSGSGFDIEAAKRGSGLGLTSMKERVQLVNGQLSIKSKPLEGTTIHARVPVSPKVKSALAGA